MIDLSRPPLHAEGVTLFPDHAESDLFHYLPDGPRLRTRPDGRPELTLLKYRLDPSLHAALGAGLLSLTVDLGVDDATLARLRGRLANHLGGPARLAPVAADEGSCSLVLIDRTSADVGSAGDGGGVAPAPGFGLVQRILGGAATELYGDNAATFFAVLEAEGVALVEGALRGGGLPAGVVYALRTTVLRPALRASVTARWSQVYNFYENRLHGGRLLAAVDIGETVQKLVQSDAITVQVDELIPDDQHAGVYQAALDQVQRYVLEELFQPSLGQAPPPEDSSGALATIGQAIKDFAGFFSLTYSLRQVDRSELKTFSYQLAVAEAERLTLSPQGTLTVLLGPDGGAARLDGLIVEVEPSAADEMKLDIASALDLAAEEIDHLDVFITYGDRVDQLLLDAATPRRQLSVWFRPEVGPQVRWRYEVTLRAGAAGLSGVLQGAERGTADRAIRVNPRELYQRLALNAVAEGVPFDRYPQVIVDVRARDPVAGWSAADTLTLDAGHSEAAFRVRSALGAPVRFERRLRYVDVQGTESTMDWEVVEPGPLVVGDPFPDVVDVQILGAARFGTAVRRLIVELRPRSAPEQVATRVLTAEQPDAAWSWAVTAGATGAGGAASDRDYEYRVTVQTLLGEVREGPWLPGPPGKLVVGEGFARLRQVTLLFVGAPLADLGLLALKVRFAFADPEAQLSAEDEMLVDDPRAPLHWSYPVAVPERQTYTYQLTFVRASGSVEAQPPVATSDLLVVVPLVARAV